MLYIFSNAGAEEWVKFGFTGHFNPWHRVLFRGLWLNAHPVELCGKLGYGGVELLALFEGDLALEKALQLRLPPDSFEFWKRARLPELLTALAEMGAVPLPLPPKPLSGESEEPRRPCCGGKVFGCFDCPRSFATWQHLRQHKAVHSGKAVECVRCGKTIQHVRNLKAHRKVRRGSLGEGR